MSSLPPVNSPPAPGSNAAKNKKKRDKKKAKKQAAADSTVPANTSPSLTDKENLNPIPLNGDAAATSKETANTGAGPLSGEASLTASSLPAAPIEDSTLTLGKTAASEASPLSGESSPLASSLPAPPITDNKIPAATASAAAAAAAAVAAAAISSKTVASSTAQNPLPETFPVSDNVKYCIQSVVASRSIDLDAIVSTIAKNVQAGDYKEKAKLPEQIKADTRAKSAAAAPTSGKSDTKSPIKKVAAGVSAAVAGAGAAVAGVSKASKSSGPAATEQPKLSESVQHCIKSVVQARSVDVYDIIHPSEKVKRPEPAAGAPAQPVMPSSAKAPDVPKKGRSSEQRHRPAFLKKKNCIIL